MKYFGTSQIYLWLACTHGIDKLIKYGNILRYIRMNIDIPMVTNLYYLFRDFWITTFFFIHCSWRFEFFLLNWILSSFIFFFSFEAFTLTTCICRIDNLVLKSTRFFVNNHCRRRIQIPITYILIEDSSFHMRFFFKYIFYKL